MKMRINKKKPLNLNDQLNAIHKGLLPDPIIGTPTTNTGKRSKRFIKGVLNPAEYVQMFPTPTEHGNYNKKGASKNSGDGLATVIKLFPTPKAQCHRNSVKHGDGGFDLQVAVQLWPTPRAGNPGSRPNKKGGKVLAEEVKKYPTPTANDAKNSATDSQLGRGTLTASIVETGDNKTGQLNPDWVEALMGYPPYWTDIEKSADKKMEYPLAWLNGTWEDNIPRVTRNIKNRTNRLKGLGNAVVPQIPMYLWILVMNYKEEWEGN